MALSLFLVRSWGLFVFLMCLGLVINRKRFVAMLEHMSDGSVLIAGVMALGIGTASVVGYEHWSFSWMGLVTLFGWVALIKGVLILFVPGYLDGFMKIAVKDHWYTISFVLFLVIGVYMLYAGYLAS
jgi:hypothetical protein